MMEIVNLRRFLVIILSVNFSDVWHAFIPTIRT